MDNSLQEIMIDVSDFVPQSEKKKKIWDYGYNEKYDLVVISHTGQIGDIVEIADLKIALPPKPKEKDILNYNKRKELQKWDRKPLPDELIKTETEKEFRSFGENFVNKHLPYINNEFEKRSKGVWFYNNGEATYLTGRNYMFVQWSKLQHKYYPDYRYPQRVLYYHWEACVADNRCLGQCYCKNRRSGYSTMDSSDNVDYGTQTESAAVGMMSKTSADAKKKFTKMVVPIYKHYPFFFKPIQDGTTNPKVELAFREVSRRITSQEKGTKKSDEGLNTSITHHTTTLNSMDGDEINKMSLDEIGKFAKECPFDDYWQIAKECLVKGEEVVGKVMAGSTANAHDKGGAEFKSIFYDSKLETRDLDTQQTISGLYSLFIPAEYNLSGYFDQYGNCILENNPDGVLNNLGKIKTNGSIAFLKAKRKQLASQPDKLNEELRKHPSNERHAFLTGTEDCLFDSMKIEDQLAYNETKIDLRTKRSGLWMRGDLVWIVKYESVRWINNPKGKFLTSYIPSGEIANNHIIIKGKRAPGNSHLFAGGVDSYDISGTVDGKGSKGSFHIVSKNTFPYAPEQFLLEYCDRPQNADIFYDNVMKGFVFYGCETLIENNKPRILYEIKRAGLRKYSANRPDRKFHQLSKTEKELGGIPSSSSTVPSHAEFIENYVLRRCGVNTIEEFGEVGRMGNTYFDELLYDWLTFDIHKREKFDRSISSGYALWLANKIMTKATGGKKKIYKYF